MADAPTLERADLVAAALLVVSLAAGAALVTRWLGDAPPRPEPAASASAATAAPTAPEAPEVAEDVEEPPPPVSSGSIIGAAGDPVNLLAPAKGEPQVLFETEPPVLVESSSFPAAGDLAARVALPELTGIGGKAVRNKTGDRYSPIRVLEDGTPLTTPNASCSKAKQQGEGLYCHNTGAVIFSANDGTSPASNGRTYTVTLEENRRFSGGFWLYPGDVFTVEGSPRKLGRLSGVEWIEIEALVMVETPASALDVQLHQSGAPVADLTIPAAQLAETVRLPLEAPLTSTSGLSLRVSSGEEAGYFILKSIAVGGS